MFEGSTTTEFRAKYNGEKSILGYLVFEEGGISFHEDFSLSSPIEFFLSASEIQYIDFSDISNNVFQPSLMRVFFLRLFAFARPKNWSENSCRVEIETIDGNFIFFEIEGVSATQVRAKINRTVRGYFAN